MFACKACFVLTHLEIALILEKCSIQGKNDCLLSLNWALSFMTDAIFLDIFKLSHMTHFYKSNDGEPMDCLELSK